MSIYLYIKAHGYFLRRLRTFIVCYGLQHGLVITMKLLRTIDMFFTNLYISAHGHHHYIIYSSIHSAHPELCRLLCVLQFFVSPDSFFYSSRPPDHVSIFVTRILLASHSTFYIFCSHHFVAQHFLPFYFFHHLTFSLLVSCHSSSAPLCSSSSCLQTPSATTAVQLAGRPLHCPGSTAWRRGPSVIAALIPW